MSLPKNILDIIRSDKTSLGDNPALPPDTDEKFLVRLVGDYYDTLVASFGSVDIIELGEILSSAISECKRIESGCREALLQLCNKVVNNLFHIPVDTLVLDLDLVDEVDTRQERLMPEKKGEYTFDNMDDITNTTEEIYKRRFLNALITGAAMFYAEKIEMYADDLMRIDDRLPDLYMDIIMINNLLMFHTRGNAKNNRMDGGKVDVYISDENTPVRIDAEGIIFPVLLEETIKGILELSIAHGLPKDRGKAEYITGKTDFKLAEIWDQRVGLPMWRRVEALMPANTTNISNYQDDEDNMGMDVGLNFIMMELSTLKPKHFNAVMRELLSNTREGENIMRRLSDKIMREKGKDDFDDYMTTMRKDNEFPLNDEEFTADELINDDLCSSAILDEMGY